MTSIQNSVEVNDTLMMIYELQSENLHSLMNTGSLVWTTLRTILNYKRELYVHP